MSRPRHVGGKMIHDVGAKTHELTIGLGQGENSYLYRPVRC
jgi:hypothetical protein